ncbi:unnamed protein product [Amoebophrya sp. A25]|nr:unnamed protein product [Amoebophrya sp. A25]|eukprot:GSA25T00023709001.1
MAFGISVVCGVLSLVLRCALCFLSLRFWQFSAFVDLSSCDVGVVSACVHALTRRKPGRAGARRLENSTRTTVAALRLDVNQAVQESRARPGPGRLRAGGAGEQCPSRIAAIVRTGLAIQSGFVTKDQPVIYMEASGEKMVEMLKSWLCNTAGMHGVHSSALLVVDVQSHASLTKWAKSAGMWGLKIVQSSTPIEHQRDWAYGSLGYWVATVHRVRSVFCLLRSGVSVFIVEPDAVWVRNALSDRVFGDRSYEVVGFSDGVAETFGFGFLRLQATSKVVSIMREVLASSEQEVKRHAGRALTSDVVVTGEQQFFSEQVKRRDLNVSAFRLDSCKYPSGRWYDDGAKEDPAYYRKKCRQRGLPLYVLQNNWIVGNERKILRMQRWGHWFLNEGRDRCKRDQLGKVLATIAQGRPAEADATNA